MVCRILVADDSPTIQKVIRIGLATIPNDIKVVGSFMEAVKAADAQKFDLIIADAGLPGVSTASDFLKLTDRAGQIPIVILMGSYDAVRESDLRGVGIEHVIKKPFPTGELPDLVSSILRSKLSVNHPPVTAAPLPPVEGPASGSFASAPSPQRPSAPVNAIPFPLEGVGADDWALPPTTSPSRDAPQPLTFDLGSINQAAGIPPLPETEPARKGRPAFSDDSSRHSGTGSFASAPQASHFAPPVMGGGSPVAGVSAAMETLVREELPVLVDRAVERYCAEHFKDVAREVLTNEIRRLAEEKARYLVDQ